MFKIELTEEQLDNLIDILQYVNNCEYEHYCEYLQEGGDADNHLYTKVAELMNLSWSKV
jgi:SHS2 domain-containing protein